MKNPFFLFLGLTLLPAALPAAAQDWSDFNGNAMAQKYAAVSQITPQNVSSLVKAWEVHTGDVSRANAGEIPKTALKPPAKKAG